MRSTKYRIEILFFIFWCGFFTFLSWQHVPWRDEYQAWLTAVKPETWTQFLEAVRYERHPPGHYIVLRGLQRVLFPQSPRAFHLLALVSGTFAVLTTALIVFLLPAPRWMRLLIPCGYLFWLDFGIVSRCYQLGMFFLFLALLLARNHRMKAGWVCLLIAGSMHLYLTLIAGMFFLISLSEQRGKKPLTGENTAFAGVIGLCFLGLLFNQRPPSDSMFPTGFDFNIQRIPGLWVWLAQGLTGFDRFVGAWKWNGNPWNGLTALVPLGFLLWAGVRGFPLKRYFILIALPLFVVTFAYTASLRHTGLFYITLIAVVFRWGMGRSEKILGFFLICMLYGTLRWVAFWNPYLIPPRADFSGSGEVVRTVGDRLKSSAVLLTDSDYLFFPVIAPLDTPLFDITRDHMLAYPFFKKSEMIFSAATWCHLYGREMNRRFNGKKIFFGSASHMGPPEECGKFEKIFENQRSIMGDEKYVIFERTGD